MRLRFFSLVLLTLGIITNVQAQDDNIFEVVETMPQFPNGMQGLMNYLQTNVHYPQEAEKQEIQGRVIMGFVIEKDGSISNVKVQRGAHPLLDKEAIRVVESMPKWKPGFQKGKAVRVKFCLPIHFKLPDEKKQKENESTPNS